MAGPGGDLADLVHGVEGRGAVERQIELIDELESGEQDPDQLANLFELDHLATRVRRNSENLLVLAGADAGLRWVTRKNR